MSNSLEMSLQRNVSVFQTFSDQYLNTLLTRTSLHHVSIFENQNELIFNAVRESDEYKVLRIILGDLMVISGLYELNGLN